MLLSFQKAIIVHAVKLNECRLIISNDSFVPGEMFYFAIKIHEDIIWCFIYHKPMPLKPLSLVLLAVNL